MAKADRIKVLLYLALMFAGVNCTNMTNDIFGTGICGTRPAYNPRQRIHGGSEASAGYWPWIGSMQWKQPLGHFCGCTLLSKEWVVTAAHCVVDYRHLINEITLVFGINNVNTLETTQHRVERSISGVIINPKSVEVLDIRNNDVALLRLSAPVEFTDYVRPACLATHQDEIEAYTNCWVAGWGGLGTKSEFGWSSIGEDDTFPDILQQVHMPLITEETCRSDEYRWKSILADDMICAGDEQGISTCSGDSGGPLVCQDDNHVWNLVGIVSWGRAICRETDPSVFCRVSRFLDFIQTAVTKNDRCGLEISLQPRETTALTSLGYPLHYDEYMYCFWTVIAPEGQRVFAHFKDFKLQRVDYLYIGTDLDTPKTLRYTGDQIPPEILSPEQILYVTFESDSGNSDKGFSMQLSSTSEINFSLCKNGIEILPPNKICDGTPYCYDRSDERLCPQCEPIPVQTTCGNLPYSYTYYPDSIAQTREHALDLWAEKKELLTACNKHASLLFCHKLFPPCPDDEKKWTPCKQLCEAVRNDCSAVFDFGECGTLPVEDRDTFCSFNDGDIFQTGICGTRPAYNPRQRIHGGHDAAIGSWPWIGSIQLFFSHVCGCTLLNENWAVTTADCILHVLDDIELVEVVFGTINANYFDEQPETRVSRHVAHVLLNPDWEYIMPDLPLRRNNIALLQLSTPIEFNAYVRPACLSTELNETKNYKNCMLAGWGETGDIFHEASDILQEVSLPLISSESCRSEFELGWLLSDDMICTEDRLWNRGHCAGDTGGPLVCQDVNNYWHLVGLVDFAGSCNDLDSPGVYTRISWFLDFIRTGVSSGEILCRSDQYRCNDGQCIPSLWARCNATTECSDGSDEQNCNYCPEKNIRMSLNSSLVLQSAGYPNDYVNGLSCKWTVSPVASRRLEAEFIDLGLQSVDYLYIGTEGKPRTIKYTGNAIPQLRVLSAVGESFLIEFVTNDYNHGDIKEGFSLLFTDVVDGEYSFCSNGLEILNAHLSGNGVDKCYSSGDRPGILCDPSYQFECDDGQCISILDYCNNYPDCSDHSDENHCHDLCDGSYDFLCGSGECIDASNKCDGTKHCKDGSDEVHCTCKVYEWSSIDGFLCDSGDCIYIYDKCDGIRQCNDGSDEVNCKPDNYSGSTVGIIVGPIFVVSLIICIAIRVYSRYRRNRIPRTLLL